MKVVNIRKTKKYDIYVGRGSKWGNPYSHIYGKGIYCSNRSIAIKKYEEYIKSNKELLESLHELKGKVLGCYCSPKRCHGEILIKLVEEFCK